jgi:hypothetical protein
MFEAPSGKTYSTGWGLHLPSGLSTTSRIHVTVSRTLSTAFPRSSRWAGQAVRGASDEITAVPGDAVHCITCRMLHPPGCSRARLRLPAWARRHRGATKMPRTASARALGVSLLRRGRPTRAQQNARRNLASVASNANASTSVVAFGLVAPSGKTYITAPADSCLEVYPRDSKLAVAFRGRCPHASHGRCVWRVEVRDSLLQWPGRPFLEDG